MGQESKLGKSSRLREYLALSYQRAQEGHLPFWRQLVEMFGLMVLTGNGPGIYHLSGFWRRTVPWANKLGYLSHSAYHKKVDGPVILELNPVPDRIGAAFVDVPSKWALSEPTALQRS